MKRPAKLYAKNRNTHTERRKIKNKNELDEIDSKISRRCIQFPKEETQILKKKWDIV